MKKLGLLVALSLMAFAFSALAGNCINVKGLRDKNKDVAVCTKGTITPTDFTKICKQHKLDCSRGRAGKSSDSDCNSKRICYKEK